MFTFAEDVPDMKCKYQRELETMREFKALRELEELRRQVAFYRALLFGSTQSDDMLRNQEEKP